MRYGDRAVLLDATDPLGLAAAVHAAAPAGLVDVVPGAASVLVLLATPAHAAAFVPPLPLALPPVEEVVTLPVVYDGPDLHDVAHACRLSAQEVVARHRAGAYVVALTGFAPGFGYLSGLDPALAVPRRASPRERVPAGSVAVAAGWAGVYPRATPGGWHLLGRTAVALWDLDRSPPALLRPGVRVRFT